MGSSQKVSIREFTEKEKRFLEANEVCRLATVHPDGGPHVTPVDYIFRDGLFYIATDYGTRKLRNIQLKNKVALVVDVYRPNRAVMIEGEASIIECCTEFKKIYELFHRKFAWVRQDPWDEGEAPFIAVKPLVKVSWGL